MKYSSLISFNPIESVIKLTDADENSKAREFVRTYVMSDKMADDLKEPVIDQLQMDEVIDNLGVLVVGNYGTGKSHLMSVISAVAKDADNLQYLHNKKFAKDMERIAGKFEVLRIEIGGVTMPLREILLGYIKDDFDARGISFEIPDLSKVKDNKKLVRDVMTAFSTKYPGKGYLIVIDEFLSYLTSRDERQIVTDLEFFRIMGEMCSKSRLRLLCGVQEKIFDNPRFSFVSSTLMHIKDRFTQIVITKEATSYVVSERILKKTPEQKATIRKHLEKFCNLYTGMSSKLDEFVDLYPIHPSYIDVFNKIYLIENRHILKNISVTIRNIFNTDVPEDAPGIISFDNYWPAIKNNGLLKTDVTISRVVTASGQLEEIIKRAFPKPAYKPLAIQIIYALSVHRLTTNGLDVQFGLTAENLKDDLCLHLMMPEQDADFLLGLVKQTLRDIMTTVSGQFIVFNEANNQYYIDVTKNVDYDEKIKQKATILADGERNRYFYDVVYKTLAWEKKEYVPNFKIYEHDIIWHSHCIFREGYLFMGLPGERSTAQPERDFYIHIMPPFGNSPSIRKDLADEVYFTFKSNNATSKFKEELELYAAACELSSLSEGKDKDAYDTKSTAYLKNLKKFLNENKNTCFDVSYKGSKQSLMELLKGGQQPNSTFADTINLAASICFEDYFNGKYPDFPVMKVQITRQNMEDTVRVAFNHFAGKKTQQSRLMLESFGVLDGDKIKASNSKYADYFIKLLKALPAKGVLNYSDLFEPDGNYWQMDRHFHIWNRLTPIIFLAMVHSGAAVITTIGNETITAASLDKVTGIKSEDLYEFKFLSKPAQMAMAELKRLFEVLELNPVLLDNPNDREKAVENLLAAAKELCDNAVTWEHNLNDGFELWGETLVNQTLLENLEKACAAVKEEFSNYAARFNTPAKLNNFTLSSEAIDELGSQIGLIQMIPQYLDFKNNCSATVSYIASIEGATLGEQLKSEIEIAKNTFRQLRDGIADGASGEDAARAVNKELEAIKKKYIDLYFNEHKKKRLDMEESKSRNKVQESQLLVNLRKLRAIDILSGAKLTEIEQDLAALKTCYELTATELRNTPVCPHCHFTLDENSKNVHGQLDNLEERIEALAVEWTKTLLDTISDPLVQEQKQYLAKKQVKAIDDFVSAGTLPAKVDDNFVSSIQALLKNYEPVVITVEDLTARLEQLPPMDEAHFKERLNEIVSEYTQGKEPSTLRIVVKRQGSERSNT